MDKKNPWAARFLPLLKIEEIERRTRVEPETLSGLFDLPAHVAVERLKASLELIFIPTQNSCRILLMIVERAVNHCITRYPDNLSFLSGVYNHRDCVETAACITGLAGSGKTELVKALGRMLQPDSVIDVGAGHSPFPLKAHWKIKIKERKSLIQMFSPFFVANKVSSHGGAQEEELSDSHPKLIRALGPECSRRAFRDGISILTVDELQSFTQSAQANTLVTKTLLFCTYIGIPFFYICNYSLGHRLFRRPQEDRHRLLTDPHVLLPDEPSSKDWIDYLTECKRVAGDWLQFDPLEDGDTIHQYSAGLKRLVVKLILFSFEEARTNKQEIVTLRDITQAYYSMRNTVNRQDVEDIKGQSISGEKVKGINGRIRLDIWCPFDLPKNSQKKTIEKNIAAREKVVGTVLIKSSLTADERDGLKIVEKKLGAPKKAKAVPLLAKKKKGIPTAEDLLANAQDFLEQHFNKK